MSAPYFLPICIGDETFDFSHLEPFTLDVDSEKAGRTLVVHVRFTAHCFTKGYSAETHPDGEPILRDHGGRERTFCRTRYALSSKLRGLIESLAYPRVKVWQTAERRNWAHSVTVDTPKGPYHVFFELRKAPGGCQYKQDLNLVVESAYPEDPALGKPNLLGNMAFVLLCGKVFLRESVATRR